MSSHERVLAGLLVCIVSAAALRTAAADTAAPATHESVEVTATRLPEDPIEVPASIQIVSGDELDRLQIRTLWGALSLVMGVSVAPGGDGGPASSVPEMMGLREFDAFLLVVDDVPWGGAFNPALATLDLTNVERIEVLRGAAPVMYGATSFVGVIHVIHRAPGDTPGEVRVSAGNYDTFGLGGFWGLPSAGSWRHSISAGYDEVGYKDDRTSYDRAHALYRGAADLGGGKLRLDLDVTILGQDPASPHPRVGTTLTTLIPIDANHNPADAKMDEDHYHVVAGYSHPALGGDWTTTLAFTRSEKENVKGFLRGDFDVPPDVSNADGFRQTVDQTDVYFDTHWSKPASNGWAFVFGVDELFGKGEMKSENFEYHASLDGSNAPSSEGITIDERPEMEDERSFAGLYGQATWTPTPRFRIDVGARLNVTTEDREGEVELPGGGGEEVAKETQDNTRGSGTLGLGFRLWESGPDSTWIFASYRNAFKPAVVDFGPEAEGGILEPEDAQMVEAGIKGRNAGGKLAWELSAYHMNFDNVVVATQVDGLPALENVGEEVFDGVEAEASWAMFHDFRLQASVAYHNAEFGDYLADFDGTLLQLDGNRIEMSARELASIGFLYLPEQGFNASAIGQYVGDRYLNKRNTALADAYTTWAAGVGYRFGAFEIRVDGFNLSDERDPVAESELGDAQYYLLPALTVVGSLVYRH
jgi:outer membrane receptor protein involved in Fe transport